MDARTPQQRAQAKHDRQSYEQRKSAGLCTERGCPDGNEFSRVKCRKHLDKDTERQRHYYSQLKTITGQCAYTATCSEPVAEGHVYCRPHLDAMLAYTNEMRTRRMAKKLCIQCGKPAFAELQTCLLHRQGHGLPSAVLRGIKEYRQREKEAQRNVERDAMRPNLHLLTDRQRLVITLRNGLDGNGDRTLQEIGDLLGVTRERIRQIETKALLIMGSKVPAFEGGRWQRALKQMGAGDSILCSSKEAKGAVACARRLGYTAESHKQNDGQYRVWLLGNGKPQQANV